MSETDSLFDRLPEDERRALRVASRRRRFGRGDPIFYEGDLGDSLHLIDKGHVAIRVTTPLGETVTLTVLGPGDSFGEQALMTESSRRTASAVCLDATETLSITGVDFGELRERLPAIDRFLVEVLSTQVHRLSELLVENLHLDAETRVLRRVHSLCANYESGDGMPVIPITQEDIATMAGTTRPTVNKALRVAEDDGIVTLTRGRITVLDQPRLAKRARI
jgi:CRP/FNR family cyclic AMP-dependent transcriptional regulator